MRTLKSQETELGTLGELGVSRTLFSYKDISGHILRREITEGKSNEV